MYCYVFFFVHKHIKCIIFAVLPLRFCIIRTHPSYSRCNHNKKTYHPILRANQSIYHNKERENSPFTGAFSLSRSIHFVVIWFTFYLHSNNVQTSFKSHLIISPTPSFSARQAWWWYWDHAWGPVSGCLMHCRCCILCWQQMERRRLYHWLSHRYWCGTARGGTHDSHRL